MPNRISQSPATVAIRSDPVGTPVKLIQKNPTLLSSVPLMSSRLFAIRQTTVVAEAFHLTFILEARKSNCVVLYHNQQLLHTAPSALEMIVRLLF